MRIAYLGSGRYRVKVSFLLMAMRSLLYWLWVMGDMAKAKTMAITLGRIRAKAR